MKCRVCNHDLFEAVALTRENGELLQKTEYCLKCGSLYLSQPINSRYNIHGDIQNTETFIYNNLFYIVYKNAAGLTLCKKEIIQ